MLILKRTLIFFFILLSVFLFALDKDWQFIYERENIQVFTKNTQDSDFKAYKGIGHVEGTIGTLLALMDDLDSYPQWNGNCIHAEIIRPMHNNVMIQYFINSAPWPIKGRDMILKTKSLIERKKGTQGNKGLKVTVNIEAIDEELVPVKKEYIRITKLKGYWIFEGLSASETLITYMITPDIGGRVPPSLANISSRTIPYKTIKGIRKMVKMQKYIIKGKNFF